MDIHFNHTAPANASADTLWEVLTDYTNYPSFNSAVINVQVVEKNADGAHFVADRNTKIGKKVQGFDRYERNGQDFSLTRTYGADSTSSSTWTVHPVDADHCELTIDATARMAAAKGLIMRPALKHLFYGINFDPFIGEAERRAQAAASRPEAVPAGA